METFELSVERKMIFSGRSLVYMRKLIATAVLFILAGVFSAHAQWTSQSIALKPGWNAVYLHVDPSYAALDDLVGADQSNPILEVWKWAPAASLGQFVESPSSPSDPSQWVTWVRGDSTSVLQRLTGNTAYLVRVATNFSIYTWTVKGKPMAPSYQWTTAGLNFFGFPTVAVNAPSFTAFLANSAVLQNGEIYQYTGGDLGANNPSRVVAFRATPVTRGAAFWIRSGSSYSDYYGPFSVTLTGSGLAFGQNLNSRSFRLKNMTATNLSVTLRLLASETPPSGQSNIAGAPPMVVRGAMNMTNLTYGCSNLPVNGSFSCAVPSGLEVEVVLGVARANLSGYHTGDLLAGILRVTDSLGQIQVDLPVSATVGSTAGLWVGSAAVTQVGEYLKTYQRDAANNVVADTNGQYIVSGVNTNLGNVSKPYPLRLILHNPADGSARLLQRVFCGPDASSNTIVTTQQSLLDPNSLSKARRISAAHLPWSAANNGWPFDGNLAQGATLNASIAQDYTDPASNPFVHAYHPDHDNLDATFKNVLPQGSESYGITRVITLQVTPPGGDFDSLTGGAQTLSGTYSETVSLLGLQRAPGSYDTRQFHVGGSFTLNRISDISTLTTP